MLMSPYDFQILRYGSIVPLKIFLDCIIWKLFIFLNPLQFFKVMFFFKITQSDKDKMIYFVY